MRLAARSLALATAAVASLVVPLSSPVAATERICGGAGRPACTILRPPSAALAAPEAAGPGPRCIVAVGGFVSTNGDATFDPLLAWADGDLRFRTYHFGYDDRDRFPYDSTGSIDESAETLSAFIASLKGSCGEVHLVTHSMGGAVADRAFAMGMSGVRTYVALAGPHNGATVARIVVPRLDRDPLLAAAVHAILLDGPDPTTPAGRDLAAIERPHRMVRDATSLRLRLATDALVLRRDSLDRRVDAREYLPQLEWDQVDGHGGVLDSREVRDAVWATIVTDETPPDPRSDRDRLIAEVVSREVEVEATKLYAEIVAAATDTDAGRTVLGAAAIAAIAARAVASAAREE